MTTIQTSDLESRFSFGPDGQPIDGPAPVATPEEIDRHLFVGERTRIRRRTKEMEAPGYDGNQAARVLMAAIVFEKKTYERQATRTIQTVNGPRRVKKHYRGRLGPRSIELLRVLNWFGRKYGRIFPKLQKLADTMRCCVDTIIDALDRLIDHGFVAKHRRSRLITTTEGPRWVQDSNAYTIQMPDSDTGAGRMLCAFGILPSESTLSGVSAQKETIDSNEQRNPSAEKAKGWSTPYRMPDGTWV